MPAGSDACTNVHTDTLETSIHKRGFVFGGGGEGGSKTMYAERKLHVSKEDFSHKFRAQEAAVSDLEGALSIP